MIRFSVPLLVILILLAGALPCLAISVAPSSPIEATVRPGESYQGLFRVYNDQDIPITVIAEIEPWATSENNPNVNPLTWIEVGDTVIVIPANGAADFPFKATLPEGSIGERIAMFFFWALPNENDPGISIRTRMGTAFYLASEGTEQVEMIIDNVRVLVNPAGSDVPVLIATVKNHGNIHIRPAVSARLYGNEGQSIQLQAQQGFPVFPGLSVDFSMPWPDYDLWIDSGEITADVYAHYAGRWGTERRLTLDPRESDCLVSPVP